MTYISRLPFIQFRNITTTLLPCTITEGLQHSHTVLSGDAYTNTFFPQVFPSSVEAAPNILFSPSRRSSQTAYTNCPSAASAIRFSFATVSMSLILADLIHF